MQANNTQANGTQPNNAQAVNAQAVNAQAVDDQATKTAAINFSVIIGTANLLSGCRHRHAIELLPVPNRDRPNGYMAILYQHHTCEQGHGGGPMSFCSSHRRVVQVYAGTREAAIDAMRNHVQGKMLEAINNSSWAGAFHYFGDVRRLMDGTSVWGTTTLGSVDPQMSGSWTSGSMLNSPPMDGFQMDGFQMNGSQMNRTQMNGTQMNGTQMNGTQMNGTQMNWTSINELPENRNRNGSQVNGSQGNELQGNGLQGNGLWINGTGHQL